MKSWGVTATLIIGKRRVVGIEWDKALLSVKVALFLRRLNYAEYIVALAAIGTYGFVTGKEIK